MSAKRSVRTLPALTGRKPLGKDLSRMGDEDDAVAVADAEAAPHRQIEHLRFRQAPAQGKGEIAGTAGQVDDDPGRA